MRANDRKPDFFIVGAPKSGTTAMDRYLGQHPEIFMPKRKEVHFFGSDLRKIPHHSFVLDPVKYRALFSGARHEKRIGESSVMYLYSSLAPTEIKAFSPDAQVIIMLRNPVDIMYAAHSHNYWGAYEDIDDFEAALEAEPHRKRGQRIPRSAMLLETLFYRDLGMLSGHVRTYFDVFGRERIHTIVFDDFAADTGAAYEETLRFLGVDPGFRPSFTSVNPNKGVRSWRLQANLQRPPAIVRLAMRAAPEDVALFVLGKVARLNTRYEPRKPMPAELRRQLCREYEPEVKRLSELLERDLTHWSMCP